MRCRSNSLAVLLGPLPPGFNAVPSPRPARQRQPAPPHPARLAASLMLMLPATLHPLCRAAASGSACSAAAVAAPRPCPNRWERRHTCCTGAASALTQPPQNPRASWHPPFGSAPTTPSLSCPHLSPAPLCVAPVPPFSTALFPCSSYPPPLNSVARCKVDPSGTVPLPLPPLATPFLPLPPCLAL